MDGRLLGGPDSRSMSRSRSRRSRRTRRATEEGELATDFMVFGARNLEAEVCQVLNLRAYL